MGETGGRERRVFGLSLHTLYQKKSAKSRTGEQGKGKGKGKGVVIKPGKLGEPLNSALVVRQSGRGAGKPDHQGKRMLTLLRMH